MKYISSIVVFILMILSVAGCTNSKSEYKYIEETKASQSESGVTIENRYPEYTKINVPTIKKIL